MRINWRILIPRDDGWDNFRLALIILPNIYSSLLLIFLGDLPHFFNNLTDHISR